MATALRLQGSLLRKIVNRLSSSAMAKVTVSQVSRALMRPEPSLICRSWATTWAKRLRMSRSSPTMAAPGKRRVKAHGQSGNRPWGSTRFEFDNRAPSAPNAGSASHVHPMVCVRGRSDVCASGRSRHSFGVAITILYDALQHHATDFTSIKDADKFRHQKLETPF